jgi:adhesin transport system outer membrane protein
VFNHFSFARIAIGALVLALLPLSIQAEVGRELGQASGDEAESLSLGFLLQRAIQTHPQVDAGRADVRSATQGVKSARWQYFPTPAVSYQRAFADDNDPSFQGDDYATVVSLEQPLWTGGRLRSGIQGARANLEVSKATLEESQRELALRLVQTYGDWLSASLQRQSLAISEERHQTLFEQVERRAAGGVSTGSDLELARGRLESVKADRVATAAREYRALAVLSELVGLPLNSEALELGREGYPRLPSGSESELIVIGLQKAPAIRRAEADIRAARAEIKSRRSQTRPDLFVRFERQFNNLQFANRGPDSRVLVGVRSQLGAGLSSFSGVSEARESLGAAIAARNGAELMVREQIRSDLALVESFDLRLKALDVATKTAQDVYESYERQFLTGRKSWLDVMNSARDLQQARLQLADVTAGRLTLGWRLFVQLNSLPGT